MHLRARSKSMTDQETSIYKGLEANRTWPTSETNVDKLLNRTQITKNFNVGAGRECGIQPGVIC